MDIETAWYEFSPYVYLGVGAMAIYYASEPLARLPGLLLIASAITIVRLRWSYRRAEETRIARAADVATGKAKLPGVDTDVPEN